MRAGGCTVHQALSNDAATIIKQSVTLARRRGHAQVTPLHVASTMLSSSSGLLRSACLQSHSHPLQCKALELCFNVALNRLPASSSSPFSGNHSHPHPSISNALIAAFKRAHAHQRRGSADTQQQQLLAVKIELEQLIVSILDDPSVSRVMREADFSSTEVKANVEKVVSLEICSKTMENNHPCSPTTTSSIQSGDGLKVHGASPDVSKVIESMMNNKKRNTIIVGESAAAAECVIKGVRVKFENKDVPQILKVVKFTNLPSHNFPSLSKEEVEHKLDEIRSLVCDSRVSKSGLILFLGDLKWISDSWAESIYSGTDHQLKERNIHRRFNPLEHMVTELGNLAASYARLWIMGVASFQTYVTCRDGHPSVKSLLDLEAVTVGMDNNLALSLNTESNGGMQTLSGYSDITSNKSQCSNDATSTLPKWLQQCKNENKPLSSVDHLECTYLMADVNKKWHSECTAPNSIHLSLSDHLYSLDKTMGYSKSVLSPSSSTSKFYMDNHRSSNCPSNDRKIWLPSVPLTKNCLLDSNDKHNFINSKPGYPFNSKSSYSYPYSTIYRDAMEPYWSRSSSKSEDLSVDNLKHICSALEIKVPWQKDIIPVIASTILKCRSGMVKRNRKCQSNDTKKNETWFYFQGVDIDGKEKIARELARVMFGSYTKFVSISLNNFSSPREDSTENSLKNKRGREEQSCSYFEKFGEEVSCDPHRVFHIGDIEQADTSSKLRIKNVIKRGRIVSSNGVETSLCDAIIIFSCESFSSRSRVSSPSANTELQGSKHDQEDHKHMDIDSSLNLEDANPCLSLDLNLNIPVDDDDNINEARSVNETTLIDLVDTRVDFNLIQGL